jgi:aspartyl-tRNA(Asn)/glutamyl-tRNA(Gln) amidotransferase subunit A
VIDSGSAVASVEAALRRIEHGDATIGSFVDVRNEQALADAERSDSRLPLSLRGPLEGLPIAIKELFDVKDSDGSYGSEVLAGRRATRDAAVVTALRRSGAVVVGTTRSHEFGWGITTQHATRGSTRNPWDTARVPGGSSGGSAAAVSAGFVDLAVGSDTGGSIRLPAAFCGVLGLKTTWGRISRAGGVALAPSFDTVGFLARNVALLRAAFDACTGADPEDPPTMLAPDPVNGGFSISQVSRLRFAVPAGLSPFRPEQGRAEAVELLCGALSRLGMYGTDANVPDALAMLDTFVPLQMAEALDVHTNVLQTYPEHAERYGGDVRSRLELAERVTISQYLAARRQQESIRSAFWRAFQVADILVSPVGPTGPSFADTPDSVSFNGEQHPMRTAMMAYTIPQNLAGLPSITCPVGFDSAHMPIGIQLTGAPWTEPMLLSVAAALEADGVITVPTPELPVDRNLSPEAHR